MSTTSTLRRFLRRALVGTPTPGVAGLGRRTFGRIVQSFVVGVAVGSHPLPVALLAVGAWWGGVALEAWGRHHPTRGDLVTTAAPTDETYTDYDPEEASQLDAWLADAGQRVTNVNHLNGWFDTARSFGEDIALLHSEVSEALEEYRDHGLQRGLRTPSGDIVWGDEYPAGMAGKPLGVPSELADVLVRLLDTAHRYGVDLGAEFRRKLAYNSTRGYKHGGKSL